MVHSYKQLRKGFLYCLINKTFSHVLKLQNGLDLIQKTINQCVYGSAFRLIDIEEASKGITARIMDSETFNFLGVGNNLDYDSSIKGVDREIDDKKQLWQIVKSENQGNGELVWFNLMNVGAKEPMEVPISSTDEVNVVVSPKFEDGVSQQFAIMVIGPAE